jgi:serpin B
MSPPSPSVDDERQEATAEGAVGEHELGSRDKYSRPRSPRPTRSRGTACLGPGGPADVAPFHGGWHPAATETQDDVSGQRAVFHGSSRSQLPVLEPERDADGRASCLPLAREVGIRAAGEKKARNFVVSPVSLHAALALVAAGARGETQRELLGFLGAGSLAELHRAAATELVGRLPGLPQTSFASGVWVAGHTSSLKPEFMDVAASRYAAVAESVDFVTEPEEARRRINAFVSETTKGRVRDLLPPGSVDTSTVVVLANALYFKGTWALQFDRSRTFLAPFHRASAVHEKPR